MLVEASPRHVPASDLKALASIVAPARSVAVLADPDDRLINAAVNAGVDALQLHGAETPDRTAEIKARSGLEIWKALGVSDAPDLDAASRFAVADRLLIDAKPPKGAGRTGGHGAAFDWSILDGWTAPRPWILAGGLKVENVAAAIARTGAGAVDVSSGVERARGVKDAALIKAFIDAAKAA